jgi:hypothetical protein
MFCKNAIISLDHNILKGYVMPGCKDEVEIQKAIADYLASIIAEVGGCVICQGDGPSSASSSPTPSDAGR